MSQRLSSRALTACRAALGLRRKRRVGPATYIERDARELDQCLEQGTPKVYDVVFRDAPAMRVRITPDRPYADVTGPGPFLAYRILADQIKPGMRVLDARCRSGLGAAWIADRVSNVGSVVAIDDDHEFIRFARRRHAADHLAFEIGSRKALAGELDGSFDAVVVSTHAPFEVEDVEDWWRLIEPGGFLGMLLQPGPASEPDSDDARKIASMLRALPGPYRLESHTVSSPMLGALLLRRPRSAQR